MDEKDIRRIQRQLTVVGVSAESLNVDEFLEVIDNATAMGPLLDPTRCNSEWLGTAADWEKLARAVKSFQHNIEDINLGTQGKTLGEFLKMIEDAAKFDEDDSGEILEAKLEQCENLAATIRSMLGVD